jgi:FAD/FMN-containing dehydrogenase
MSGWANYPSIVADVYEPPSAEALAHLVQEQTTLIARGNGKSYGDASLAPVMVSTLALSRIFEFDAEKGIISCESGAMLSDLLKVIVPAGWFFPVTPGIKSITVGGAIASDVHGKNHPTAGCFSQHLISFDLVRADGAILNCSKTENADLFWQTCGGMGWTGVIVSARFQLMRIHSTRMWQKTVRAPDLAGLFNAFESHRDWPYAAAWVDCTNARRRGAVYFARHLEKQVDPLVFEEKKVKNIPFFAPSWFLNPWSIRAHNFFYNRKSVDGEREVDLDQYFYPLDSLQNWNRFYGRRGFVQYQFCLPEDKAQEGMHKVLEIIAKSGETPFLSVLKRHGDRPQEAIHSFPIRGYSLALDFPRTAGIPALVKQLDELVDRFGGKIYLTKDALSGAQMGRVNPKIFGEDKFCSLLKERIAR